MGCHPILFAICGSVLTVTSGGPFALSHLKRYFVAEPNRGRPVAKRSRATALKHCIICSSLFEPIDPVIDACSRDCARLQDAPARGLMIRSERNTAYPNQTKAQIADEQARLRQALRAFRLDNKLYLRQMAFLLGSKSGAACVAHSWESGVRPITPRVARLLEAYIQGYRPGFWPRAE